MTTFHISREQTSVYYLTVEADSREQALLEAEKDFNYHTDIELIPDKTEVRYLAQEVVNFNDF